MFGIATAVQASIPDASGVAHGCYLTKPKLGTADPRPGDLRLIDTDAGKTCAGDEQPISLATTGFVTSQINQTSFMIRGVFPGSLAGSYIDNFFCPAGYIESDGVAAPSDNFGGLSFTVHNAAWNDGEVATGVPSAFGHYEYTLSATTNVTIHATCTDARVFGLPGPAIPIGQAMSQSSITQEKVS